MTPDNHVNFRLRGIPHDCRSRSKVHDLVGSVLPVESETNLVIHSLVIHPTEYTTRVATLTFSNIPHQLSDTTKDQWVFHLPDNRNSAEKTYFQNKSLVFDTHFKSFTPLQHTDEDCQVDLVALSGLGGHAFGSFKERNGSFMWLRDALTFDVPVARILIYGYDTTLLRSNSFQNLANLGWALHADLKIIRKSNRGRPIIFIGHSLGGLVLKEAIIKMKQKSADEDCDILQSTSGFIFFGVPHEGMAIESLVPLVGDQPNRALLESLGKNSEVLHRLQEDFQRAFGPAIPKVVSYFETEKSPTARKEGDLWKLSGLPEVLVDPISAGCGSEDRHPINRNHSELVKYSSRYDEIYERVRAELERLVESTRVVLDDYTGNGVSIFLSEQQKECLRSFAFTEQDQRCKEIRIKRGTCEWLRNNAKYKSWMAKSHGLLWIQGSPGVGKSFLMKSAYTTMRRCSSENIVVSFFFHGQGVALQRTPTGLFRALLNSTIPFFPVFLSHLVRIFQEREARSGSYREGHWAWFESELQDFLFQLLTRNNKSRPVVIFIDALDECGKDSASQLLSYLKELMADVVQNGRKVKVCFSSRHYPVLGLDSVPTVIVEEQNGKDIRHVIQKQLEELPPAQYRQIEKEILTKAQGGFQWAILVTSMVTDGYAIGINSQKLHDLIRTIPQALEQLYAEILSGIPDSERTQTVKLFKWILFAGRPLVAQELRDALVTDKDMTHATTSELRNHPDWTDTVDGFERRVKHLSRGLIKFQTGEISEQHKPNGKDSSRRAQFIHQSIPEFLQKSGIGGYEISSIALPLLARPCHFDLAKSCIKYLMLRDVLAETSAPQRILSAKFPLAPYAAFFFFRHIREAETKGSSHHDILSLIRWSPQSQAIRDLARIWRILNPLYSHTPSGWPFLGATSLHVIIALGSMSAFEGFLLEDCFEVDMKDSEGNSPLLLAIKEGQIDMALMLIDRFTKWKDLPQEGVDQAYAQSEKARLRRSRFIDVDSQNEDGDMPLAVALAETYSDVVLALIKAGADIKHPKNETALVFHAIRVRNKELLVKLIEADIRLDGAICFLFEEFHKEDPGIFQDYLTTLLNARGDMRHISKGTQGTNTNGDAIHQAARQGRVAIIELLLSHGASAASRDPNGRTPLHIAIKAGHEEAAQILLPNTPIMLSSPELEITIEQQQYRLAKLLIRKGVFTSLWPILAGFQADHRDIASIPTKIVDFITGIVDIIVQKISSEIKANGCYSYATFDFSVRPLERGLDSMSKAMIRQYPTRIDEEDNQRKMALHHALEKEKEELALFLANREQPTRSSSKIVAAMQGILPDENSITLLEYAILMRYDGVQKCFANNRSYQNEEDEWCELLRVWVSPESTSYQNANGETALMRAAVCGSPHWAQLLVETGTTTRLNKRDKDGKTALMHAVLSKNRPFVQMLVDCGGANLSMGIVDNTGKTAFIHSVLAGHPGIVRIFLEHHAVDSYKKIVDGENRDALWYVNHLRHFWMSNMLEEQGRMDVTSSITLPELMLLGCEDIHIDKFLRRRGAVDYSTRFNIHIPRRKPSEVRDPLAFVRNQVSDHIRDIAPITFATVYDRADVVRRLLATRQVSVSSYFEAFGIAERFGFEAISKEIKFEVLSSL